MSSSEIASEPTRHWDDFLEQYYQKELQDLVGGYPDTYSLEIKYTDIERWDPDRAEKLLEEPDKVLKQIEEALQEPRLTAGEPLEKARVRILGLPEKIGIGALTGEYIGKMISLQGLVRKVRSRHPHTLVAAFKCQRCEHITYLPQNEGRFIEPFQCENDSCGRKGPFLEILSKATLVDRQIIEVQEPPEDMAAGQPAQSMEVILDDDLAGKCGCGDRVEIVGILRAQRRTTSSGKKPELDLHITANSLTREIKEYESLVITKEAERRIKEIASSSDIYSKLVRSIAPSIYGYEEIKEAIALQLFGGITRKLKDGTSLRGSIHALLVGDPGVAKSQLLRSAASLAPRSIYTIGSGTTGPGLTATAVRDEIQEGRWTLEAGALVLADKGYIAVDEIEKLQKEHQAGLHEALEQQTVSIAKAGITTTLNARCSCLAAANPKYGQFDRYEGIAGQIGLPPTLLSRFDLIFLILDQPDPKRDTAVARHILSVREANPGEHEPLISQDLLRKYIAYAQREVLPVMGREAEREIERFYVGQRKKGVDPKSPVPLTPRTLEALIRLSEASARIRLSKEVSLEDAERAIRLMEFSFGQVMVDPETGDLDASIITAGISKSQRVRMKTIIDLIRELQEGSPKGASRSEIVERAAGEGIKEEQVDRDLRKLMERGDVYQSNKGSYKVPK